MNFDGLTFMKALAFFNQSDHLKHSNKDSDWLIVACFMRVYSMLTTLLFALEIKFVLKLKVMRGEFNEFFIIKKK